jgi:hypothetical protein
MGYYTTYKLIATGFRDQAESELFAENLYVLSEYDARAWTAHIVHQKFTGVMSQVKWYYHRAHVVQLSIQFPSVTIDLHGVGEEYGDEWRLRARNGQTERVQARTVFDDFKILT